MLKDPRYKAIKSLIESKGISSLKDIFTIVPLTVVKQDLKVNYNTLRNRVNKPETLTVKDITALATLFETDPVDVFKLVLSDIQSKGKAKTK